MFYTVTGGTRKLAGVSGTGEALIAIVPAKRRGPDHGTLTITFTNAIVPTVTTETPASGATAVATNTTVSATFNEPVQSGTIGFNLKSSSGSTVAATVTYNSSTNTATLIPTAALANSTTYTATVSGAEDTAGDSMSGPVSWSFTTAAATTAVPATGTTYYVSPTATSGTGTFSDPFGVSQLINVVPDQTTNVPFTQGPALTILKPGDTLYFLGGTYNLNGATGSTIYQYQLICPTVSGTASQPITLSAYPGATVVMNLESGGQSLFGTEDPALNYVRFLGFTVEPTPTFASNGMIEETKPFEIGGTGDEVAYNDIIGRDDSALGHVDNSEGIRLDFPTDAWIHNNDIHGFEGNNINQAGIKVYAAVGTIIEDNYIHDNCVGIYDKETDAPNLAIYRRNWVTNNTYYQFLGNNQGNPATYFVYDNVFDGVGTFNFQSLSTGSQVYNNFFRDSSPDSADMYAGAITMIYGNEVYQSQFWNNIVLSGNGTPMWAYATYDAFTTSGSMAPITYMDYNVYDGAPEYRFNNDDPDLTLAQFQAQGFETHSSVVANDLDIFQNLTSYVLLPQWTTAGRYGDAVGPRYPVAQIMNVSRYGPGALSSGTSPAITQQPQNQTVATGGSATFSVQVNGSGLLYQMTPPLS